MSQIRYVTGDNFGAPGLYIQEITPTPATRGVLNKVVGVSGQCVRGPIGRAIEITSKARFEEVYGARDVGAGGTLIGEVWKFLLNKPFGKLVVVRAAAAAAVVASFTLETAAAGGGTAVARIDASSAGLWGNAVKFRKLAASDGVSTHWNLEVRFGARTTIIQNIDTSGTTDNTAAKVGTDDGRLITITKLAAGTPVTNAAGVDGADSDGFTLLGQTVAAFTSVAGTDGTIADTDFTGTGGPMELLNGYAGVGICAIAGRSNSVIKTKLLALAAAANDRLWLSCPNDATVLIAAMLTDVASYRDKRNIYCVNHPTTLDPQTATLITAEPHASMASDLSQTDADAHPGIAENAQNHKGISALTFEGWQNSDYDSLDAAGICGLRKRDDGTFGWQSGVTTSLTDSERQIDLRRTKDYLASGFASRLQGSQYKPNTLSRRLADKTAVSAWLVGLAKSERYVAKDETSGVPQFRVTNDLNVNTEADRALGIQRMLVEVKTIPMNLTVVLQVLISPNSLTVVA